MANLGISTKSRFLSAITFISVCWIALAFYSFPAFAEEQKAATSSTQSDSSSEQGTTICVMDEKTKKQIAKKGHEALKQMKKNHEAFRAEFKKSYKNSDAPCHYMYGSISKWWGEVFTSRPTFGNNDAAGAAVADKLVGGTLALFDEINGAKDTDVNVAKLKQRAAKSNYEIDNLAKQIGSLKDGEKIDLSSDGQDLFKEIYDKSCDSISVKEGKVICVYKLPCPPIPIGPILVPVPCPSYNRELSSSKAGFIADLNKKASQNPSYAKCLTAIDNALRYRTAFTNDREQAHTYLASLSEEAQKECTCNSSGNVLGCDVTDNGDFEKDNVNERACKDLTEYVNELTICPTCGIFEVILRAAQNLADGAFEKLAGPFQNLLLIGLGIFIAYHTLLLVGSPASQTMSKYLNTILIQGFKVAVAYILLSTPDFLYEKAITPIISSGFEFGLSLSTTDALAKVNEYAGQYTFDKGAALSSDFLSKVMGAVKGFNTMAAEFPALGRALICNAWTDLIYVILPHMSVLIEGLIVYIFGVLIMLAVGFYLLDCAIHLCILCCLMPLLVASWPFAITSRYTKTGWEMLLNIFFRFVMVGVVLATAFELVNQVLSTQESIKNAVNVGDVRAIEQALDISGLQMLLLIVCCMIAMKIVKESSTIAQKFAGGAKTGDLGAKLGGTAAAAATLVAKGAGGAAGRAAMTAGSAVAEASGMKGAAQAAGSKVKAAAGNAAGRLGLGAKAKMTGDKSNGGQSSENGSSGGAKGEGGGDKATK